MKPGTRLLAAIAIILFLVVAGLLGGLQDLRRLHTQDPAASAELGKLILPLTPIDGAMAYQAQDLREDFNMASAYYRSKEGAANGVLLILASAPLSDLSKMDNWDQGIQREWDRGDFERLETPAVQQDFYFRGQATLARTKLFQNSAGQQRQQYVIPIIWGEQQVFIQVNGPAEVVTMAAVQAMLDSVEGEPQPLSPPESNSGPPEKAAGPPVISAPAADPAQ
jgi:hypothetical protein